MQFLESYRDKKVLVTGHSGFKGSWLAFWLNKTGAKVCGISLDIPTKPAHISALDFEIPQTFIDIRDRQSLTRAILEFQPDIIFHMAAQPIVRSSYLDPVSTFETNIMGTVNVFEAARQCKGLKAIVNITSDKCYRNIEADYSYVEDDPLGGYDPYSASKAGAEIVSSSYTQSFFNVEKYGKEHNCLVASVRAGNVIGGGDWADFRLLPDIFRAYAAKESLVLKNPNAVRPWQHVLDPLMGYLMLGEKLLNGFSEYVGPWNFGPKKSNCVPVSALMDKIGKFLPNLKYEIRPDNVHEANLLMLDSAKANSQLKWQPKLNIEQALEYTSRWYKAFYDHQRILTSEQLQSYLEL